MSSASTSADAYPELESSQKEREDVAQADRDDESSAVAWADGGTLLHSDESNNGSKRLSGPTDAQAGLIAATGTAVTESPWENNEAKDTQDMEKEILAGPDPLKSTNSQPTLEPAAGDPSDKPSVDGVPDHEEIHGAVSGIEQASTNVPFQEELEARENDNRVQSPAPPPPPPKDDKYLPFHTGAERAVNTGPSPEQTWNEEDALKTPKPSAVAPNTDSEFDEKRAGEEIGNDSRSEIQNIMAQFGEGQTEQSLDDVMSVRLQKTGPNLAVFQYPPRKSSLDNLSQRSSIQEISDPPEGESAHARDSSLSKEGSADPETSSLKHMSSIASQTLPPEPDPEPDLPFDFHRFLEQLRHRTADPVAKFLRSFLHEFGRKQWMVHEQVKIISDFLTFIGNRMAQCEVWRTVSEAEFDNAKEGMEKLVMNRLYTQTFSPEIAPPEPLPPKSRRKGSMPASGPGRKGQHQEDIERDDVLAQKIRIYGWVREEHLDMNPFSDKGRRFLRLAQQELSKIKSYRAPRDKVICVLNCCKVIFGFLRNAQSDQSADSFIPLLIYTVLKANPDHLVSNMQYILRFRNQDKLGGEAGYYISSLMAAVQFIENLDRTNLTISDADFEREVEASVSAIAERQLQPPFEPEKRSATLVPTVSEKSAISHPEVTPRNSMEAERSPPRRNAGATSSSSNSRFPAGSDSDDGIIISSDDNAAVAGLLRTIQKPLSTIGRIFSDDGAAAPMLSPSHQQQQQQLSRAPLTPRPGSTPRLSPNPSTTTQQQFPPRDSPQRNVFEPANAIIPPHRLQSSPQPQLQQQMPQQQQQSQPHTPHREEAYGMSAEEAAARQASAEVAEAQRVERAEHETVVETLAGMFPGLDREVIADVVRVKGGRVGLAVDACLALSH